MEIIEADPFRAMLIARGAAMTAYAELEAAGGNFLSTLIEVNPKIGGAIFHRMNNPRSRMLLLTDLSKSCLPEGYKPFFNSLMSRIDSVNRKRIEITHWLMIAEHEIPYGTPESFGQVPVPKLKPQGKPTSPTSHTIASVLNHYDSCEFARAALLNFNVILIHERFGYDKLPWHDIFLQPLPDDVPDSHPLYLKPSEWRSQP